MLVFLLLTAMLPGDGWTTYAPEGTGLSASFPGKPTEERYKDEAGELDSAAAKLTKGKCYYSALSGRLPKRGLELFSHETLMDMYLKPVIGRNGKVLEDKTMTEAKIDVRKMVIETGEFEPTYIKAYLRVVGNKLYVLDVSSKVKADLDTAEAKQFLESFKLVEVK